MTRTARSIDISDSIQAELEKQASRERVSPSVIVERALGAYIAAQEMKYAAIDEALAEADKGVFVSREAVERWIDSWDTDNELPPPEPDVFLK
jgi:predicted transcriptional regulator